MVSEPFPKFSFYRQSPRIPVRQMQEPLLYYIFRYSGLIPLLLGLFFFSRLDRSLRILLLFLTVSFVFELYTYQLYNKGTSNLCAVNVYVQIELLLFCLYFYLLFKDVRWRRVFAFSSSLVLLLCLIMTFFQDCNQYNTFVNGATAISLILTVLAYLWQVIQDVQTEQLDKNPHFYVAMGMLFYSASTLLVFLGVPLLSVDPDAGLMIWRISWLARILLNLFIFMAILIQVRKKAI